jgi:hypothetical protein
MPAYAAAVGIGPDLDFAASRGRSSVRRSAASIPLALILSAIALTPATEPAATAAASCVRFVATNFDAPGNDNYAENLNGEWVRIKNVCATRKGIGRWKIHDHGRKHTYTIPAGTVIRPDRTITLYSGSGANTRSKLYWDRTYGAVWNNDPPEWAHLRKPDGTLMSKRAE